MEEVWKDITTLSSSAAFHRHRPTTAVAHHHQSSSVHDFVAAPICPPTQRCDPNSKNVSDHISKVYGGNFPCDHTSATLSSVFASSVSPPRLDQKDNGCGDRSYKRKMKNRESANRSRARRQAYTNELELELAHLREENATLRRRQEEMSSAAAAAVTVSQAPNKSTLVRSITAPF